jgi:serine protease AprX
MDRGFLNVGLAVGIASLLLAGLALWAGPVPQTVVAAPPAHVAPQVWLATAGGGEAEFLVVLAEQADLGAATSAPTREARLRSVYDSLRSVALRSQAPLRAELDRAGVSYRPFYVVNMLAVTGDRALVTRLAARPEVARIAANPHVRQRLGPGPRLPEPQPASVGPLVSQGIEWNVAHIHADDVWALGYTGQGIVVAGQDTGYDWHHPALVNQYRGYNGLTATHDYNWHDAIHTNDPHTSAGNPCGFDSPVPCDDQDHGTHTMGIIVGDDSAGNRIGVAPGARWIGCRNMEEGWGTPATYAECFEFFLAPYPLGGDPFADGVPGLAPHVINNSWTCPPKEGCDWDALQAVVENVRAAGIVVVASAGNSGSRCSTVGDPPAIYDAAFSVGACNGSGSIASFSSRGPVTVDGSGRLKPDVVAPGVGVRSSVPGGRYGLKSGTSMAGPHVAGTVALLWAAAPSLVGDVDGTERIIARTARPRVDTTCDWDLVRDGDPGGRPNNIYGWGIVDALAAVRGTQFELEIGKRAAFPKPDAFPMSFPPRLLVYTLSVTNTSYLTLTRIVLTDTVPVSTTFAWASGNYTQAGWDLVHGGVVTWTAARLAGQESLTATLAVTVEHLAPGTRVVNAGYGARADELLIPVAGAPVEAVVPWRYLVFPVFRNWSLEGNGDG